MVKSFDSISRALDFRRSLNCTLGSEVLVLWRESVCLSVHLKHKQAARFRRFSLLKRAMTSLARFRVQAIIFLQAWFRQRFVRKRFRAYMGILRIGFLESVDAQHRDLYLFELKRRCVRAMTRRDPNLWQQDLPS